MRPIFLTLLLNPLVRYPSQSLALARRTTPRLAYPVCRHLTHSTSLLSHHPVMADSRPDDAAQTERITIPCTSAESSASTSKQSEVVDAAGESSTETAEALPKLSAADFRVYNQMATHMEYYVREVLHCIAVLFLFILVSIPVPHTTFCFPLRFVSITMVLLPACDTPGLTGRTLLRGTA
jgi:hypothetical protein